MKDRLNVVEAFTDRFPILDDFMMVINNMAEPIRFKLRQSRAVGFLLYHLAVDRALTMPGTEQGVASHIIEGALGCAADGPFRVSITASRLIKIVNLRIEPP